MIPELSFDEIKNGNKFCSRGGSINARSAASMAAMMVYPTRDATDKASE